MLEGYRHATSQVENAWVEVKQAKSTEQKIAERLRPSHCEGADVYSRQGDGPTQPARGLKLSAEIAKSSDAFTQFMMETFVFDPNGLVSSPVAYQKLVGWCGSHGRTDLLDRIKAQNLRRYMRGVPGFERIEKGPRPHGDDRTIAKIRLRTKEERDKDFDDDDE